MKIFEDLSAADRKALQSLPGRIVLTGVALAGIWFAHVDGRRCGAEATRLEAVASGAAELVLTPDLVAPGSIPRQPVFRWKVASPACSEIPNSESE